MKIQTVLAFQLLGKGKQGTREGHLNIVAKGEISSPCRLVAGDGIGISPRGEYQGGCTVKRFTFDNWNGVLKPTAEIDFEAVDNSQDWEIAKKDIDAMFLPGWSVSISDYGGRQLSISLNNDLPKWFVFQD